MRRTAEKWRYDPRWGTAIDLDGCQFGLKVDGRCNLMLCKFRTTKDLMPKEVLMSSILCPRELTHDESPGKVANTSSPSLV